MGKRSCRDCARCTEMPLASLVLIPIRLASWALTFWNVRLLRRWCPECGHELSLHKKVGGRYVD